MIKHCTTSRFTSLRISLVGLLLLGAILTIVGYGCPISAIHQKAARVGGEVLDPYGAVLVGANVSVRGLAFESQTTTNEEGQYEIELLPGIYSIEVSNQGFCRARRASFKARLEFRVTLDFTLLLCPTDGEAPMSYESFAIKSDPSQPPDFLIRFGKKADQRDAIEFEGADQNQLMRIGYKETDRPQLYLTVVVTHDGWTISASHLTLNKRNLRLELRGDVVILDGVHETKGKRAEIDFSLPRPVVNVTQ